VTEKSWRKKQIIQQNNSWTHQYQINRTKQIIKKDIKDFNKAIHHLHMIATEHLTQQ
jgi:hypothetical protein